VDAGVDAAESPPPPVASLIFSFSFAPMRLDDSFIALAHRLTLDMVGQVASRRGRDPPDRSMMPPRGVER
jgi:hypothetical protein